VIRPEEIYAESVRGLTISGRRYLPNSIEPIGTELLENILIIVSICD
jgi:hypothetical protein